MSQAEIRSNIRRHYVLLHYGIIGRMDDESFRMHDGRVHLHVADKITDHVGACRYEKADKKTKTNKIGVMLFFLVKSFLNMFSSITCKCPFQPAWVQYPQNNPSSEESMEAERCDHFLPSSNNLKKQNTRVLFFH